MKKKNCRVHLWLEEDLKQIVQRQADEEGIPISEFCRRKFKENARIVKKSPIDFIKVGCIPCLQFDRRYALTYDKIAFRENTQRHQGNIRHYDIALSTTVCYPTLMTHCVIEAIFYEPT